MHLISAAHCLGRAVQTHTYTGHVGGGGHLGALDGKGLVVRRYRQDQDQLFIDAEEVSGRDP